MASEGLLRYGQGQAPLQDISQSRTSPFASETETPSDIGIAAGFGRGVQRGYYSTAAGAQLLGGISEQDRHDIARYQRKLTSIDLEPSQSYLNFITARTADDAWAYFWNDPFQVTAEVVAESLPASALMMLTSIAGGAVGAAIGGPVGAVGGAAKGATIGAAAGAGVGSLLVEYSNSYLEILDEAIRERTDGEFDLSSPDHLAAVLEDEDILAEARNYGLKKGIPIAVFDAASMGLAGKLLGPARKAYKAGRSVRTGARVVGAAAGEMGTQMAAGGLGEAAGEIAAGEELQPGAIAAEIIGELGGGAGEVALGTTLRGMRRAGGRYAEETGTPIEAPSQEEGFEQEEAERLRLRAVEEVGVETEEGAVEDLKVGDLALNTFLGDVVEIANISTDASGVRRYTVFYDDPSVGGQFTTTEGRLVDIRSINAQVLRDQMSRANLTSEESSAVIGLLGARASVRNQSLDSYLKQRLVGLVGFEYGEKERGFKKELDDGRSIIGIFKGSEGYKRPSFHTVVHEIGHLFRYELNEDQQRAANAWVRSDGDTWTSAQEEKFANGFVTYLHEGVSPTPALRSVFEKFKLWLRELIFSADEDRFNYQEYIDPSLREVFNTLLRPEAGAVAPEVSEYERVRRLVDFTTLQRWEPAGNVPSHTQRKGLYLSPADVESPHAEEGWVRHDYINTAKNVLDVSDVEPTEIRGGAGVSGAGVRAIRKLDEPLFQRLQSMRNLYKGLAPRRHGSAANMSAELKAEVQRIIPGFEVEPDTDVQDVFEEIGAELARRHGYDAIQDIDDMIPEFSEFAALTPDAVQEAGAVEEPVEAVTEEPLALPSKRRSADLEPILDEFGNPVIVSAKPTAKERTAEAVEDVQFKHRSALAYLELLDRADLFFQRLKQGRTEFKAGELSKKEGVSPGAGVWGTATANKRMIARFSRKYVLRLKETLRGWRQSTRIDGDSANELLRAVTIKERYYRGGKAEGEGFTMQAADVREANMTEEQVDGVIARFSEQDKQQAQEVFNTWNEILRDIVAEYPRIAKFMENLTDDFSTDYVPNVLQVYQDFIDPDVQKGIPGTGTGFHKVTGGGKGAPTVSPIDMLFGRIPMAINMGINSKVAAPIVEMAETGAIDFEEAAKSLGLEHTQETSEIVNRMVAMFKKGLGLEWANIREETLRSFIEFRGGFPGPKRNVDFTYMEPETGNERTIRVPDKVMKSLQMLHGRQIGSFVKIAFAPFTRVFRAFTTGVSLVFAGRNPSRDIFNAKIQTYTEGENIRYFQEWSTSMWKMITGQLGKSDFRKIAEKLGVTGSYYTQQHVQALDDVNAMDIFKDGGTLHTLKQGTKVLEKVENLLGLTEYVTRGVEMMMLFRQTMREGQYTTVKELQGVDSSTLELWGNDIVDADGNRLVGAEEAFNQITDTQQQDISVAGMRVATDFADQGYTTQLINQVIPYYGPAMGGLSQAMRVWRRDPQKAALLAFQFVTLPTLALWWKNKDEEWYKDQPANAKYLYMQLQVGDHIIKLPKPFEWGQYFGTIPEALLDSLYQKNPEIVIKALGSALEYTSPVDIIGADGLDLAAGFGEAIGVVGKMVMEENANRTFFGGRPIVPASEQHLPPEEQYGPYTSGAAKLAGQITGTSPRRIEHIVRSVIGRAPFEYMEALSFFWNIGTKGEIEEASKIPMLGGFVQRGGIGGVQSESTNEIYADLGKLEQIRQSSEQALTEEQLRYLEQVRSATKNLRLVRDQLMQVTDQTERVRLGNRMRSIAQAALALRPSSLEPTAAPESKQLAKQINSISNNMRSVIVTRERETLRGRAPQLSEQRLTQLAGRRSPTLRRISHLSARARIAERSGNAPALRATLADLTKIAQGI